MSEENIKLVEAAVTGLQMRDAEATETLFDEAVEWRPALTAGGAVEGRVYKGHSGMRQYIQDIDSDLDEVRLEIVSFESVGPARVLYRGRMSARGRASGIPLDVPIWGLWEIREEKLFRGAGFLSEEAALKAAALSE